MNQYMSRMYLYILSLFGSMSAVFAEPVLARSTFIDGISENIWLIVGWITGLDPAVIESGNVLFYGLAVIIALSIIAFLIIQKVYDIDDKYESLVYLLAFIVSATILKLTGITVDILDFLGTATWIFTLLLTIYLVYAGYGLMRKKFGDINVANYEGHAERVKARQDARVEKQTTDLGRRELGKASQEVGAGRFPAPNKLKRSIKALASADGYAASKIHVDNIAKSILKARTHYGDENAKTLLVNAQPAISGIAPGTTESQTDAAIIRSRTIPTLTLDGRGYTAAGDRTHLSNAYTGAAAGPLNNYLVKLNTEYPTIGAAAGDYDTAKTTVSTEKSNLVGHISSGDAEQAIRTLQELSNALADVTTKETVVRTRMSKLKADLNKAYTPASAAARAHDLISPPPAKASEFQKFHNSAKDGVDIY